MNSKSKAITLMLLLACVFYFSAGSVNIKDISNKLAEDVKILKNEEMGFLFSEKLFHNLRTVPSELNSVSSHLQQMVEKLENKINSVFSAMDDATQILSELSSNKNEPSSALLPCAKEKTVVVDAVLGANLMNSSNISNVLGSKYILYQMRKNVTKYKPLSNALKQEYIISEQDLNDLQYSQFSECLGHDETIIWKNYMSHQNYLRKNIVLLLDHGGSLSKRQLHISKSIAKQMLGSLSENDQVALVAVASNWSLPDRDCSDNQLLKPSICMKSAKPSYLLKLNNFIDSLAKGSGATNHVMGIQKALEVVLKTSNLTPDDITVIIYISRGLLSSLTEARRVLTVMAQQTNFVHFPIYIHTCAVIDEMKSVMYETHFLRDVADQNFMKHNISHSNNYFRKPGYMMTVNKTEDIGFVMNKFFSIFNSHSGFNTNKKISLPYWDLQSGEFTVSFTRGHTSENTKSFTMIGTDVYFSNMVEDVTYYSSDQQYSYAFLIDLEGRVLVHPSILRPSVISHQLSFVDIKYIETVPDIKFLRQILLSEYKGNHLTKNNMGQELQYTWMRIGEWYVLAIVINQGYHNFNIPFKAAPNPSVKKLLYQDLDGSENHKLCRHLSQIATLDVGSLYLSRSCFQSPYSASRTTQGGLVDQGYLAYLKDDTGLLINPGLKREVRHEVSALAHILDFLRKKHLSSEMSKYIVRRYAASYSGVLQMFPGSVLTNGLETTKRSWFLRALQHQNKTIFIPPYLDKGGAGYIVTIAYATPQFVIAMDLTYGYMLKMLLRYMPYCLNDKITCFLIDDQGYIIFHRNLTDLNGSRPVEQQHIVHRESLVANDILNHKQFIKKLLCNDYGDNKIQRYYRLNTSFTDDLVNHVPGEQCVTYHITSVPDTNIFVGVVNASCDVVPAFCPCSIIDRLCLNCNRMEQKECECPCECPFHSETSSCQEANQNLTDNLPCKWNVEEALSEDAHFSMDLDSSLEPCFPFNCQTERSVLDCVGVIGCEWCMYDMNGDLLKNPFCSTITTCFSGVYGLSNPYRSNIPELSPTNDSEYSPLGPILGLVTAMFILFILLYICYRSYTNPPVNGLYLSSAQNQMRLSDLNVNEVFHDSGNHRDKLLTDDCLTPSPYCVASNYRRNNTAADSDHGYSTMTPHDESEHLSLAPMEIDSLEDDVMSDNASMSTSVSMKNNPSHIVSPMLTKIPHRNCIIVPVTVHRNMDATENRSLCLS
ncbi:VWFA and cache domain-containing protein 1 [Dendroctonus ponderosae]|uniref:VWFA and cache domain-containing protein 1 n=1 Tax=Dendroctonus ponderosae TaxID=77166 RepID=UPI0020352FF5|nr:VWFA and cache domain-containing protein 1 [Dendroctonus ponderosae]